MSTPVSATAPVTPAAPKPPGLLKRVETRMVDGTCGWLHDEMVRHTWVNNVVGDFTGPYVKHKFNAPAAPGAPEGPPPLKPETVEQARQIMAANFKPQQGKVLVCIAGGGDTTVHCFVVSGVTPDGHVQITQAIAQTNDKPEDYSGIGGFIRKMLDKLFHNPTQQMKGVVVEDWAEYAKRSGRNSIVIMELDTDPAKAQTALKKLQGLVGKPYDRTMTASDPATPSSEQAMYCTEISAWFVNQLRPGTIKTSIASGFPVYQVADHMRATDINGGPLKVLYNGENRLDIAHADPHPH